MHRAVAFVGVIAVVLGCACSSADQEERSGGSHSRYVEGDVFISRAGPPIQIRIDRAFTYVGNVEFDLEGSGGVARLDLHVFVDAHQDRVDRMMIIHFEELMGPIRSFSDRITNPVNLGGESYHQNTYFFSVTEDIERKPDGEIAKIMALLEGNGYALEDELMTSRFFRIVGEERRNEIIIFYDERISTTGHTLAEISQYGGIRTEYSGISSSLTKRSLNSFSVLSL
ncbi:MAG: hypothetical protein V3T39_08710 [Gammaproteobacteria bacterium]